MTTNYGEINNKQVIAYFDKLVNRVFKILPMSEENSDTIDEYVNSLVRELIGNSKILYGEELLIVVGTLKGLPYENHKLLKSDIFKAIDIIEKVKKRVE